MKVNTKDFAIICGLISILILCAVLSVKFGYRNATARDVQKTEERLESIEQKLDQILKGKP